jgi:hypothetical protein
MADQKNQKDKETTIRGSGQRVVEQPRGRTRPAGGTARGGQAPATRVGTAGHTRGVQGRPVPRAGVSSARAQTPRDRAEQDAQAREQAEVASEQEQEQARQAEDGTTAQEAEASARGRGRSSDQEVLGPGALDEDQQRARDRELRAVPKELRDTDTSGHQPNESTRSQQPTNLESKGGTTQPHPTVAARAAVSSRQEGPPGRSHDRGAAGSQLVRDLGGASPEGTIMVRATATGYYNHARRREGDVFSLFPQEGMVTVPITNEDGEQLYDRNDLPMTKEVPAIIPPERQFSRNWMEVVNADEEERISTAQQAIDREHDQTLAERAGFVVRSGSNRASDRNVTE